jgi:large subunit ribosomal protein L22
MEVKATVKNTGISPRKIRLLADLVRGKKVNEALAILKYAPTPNARVVAKVVKSAAANAENNFQMAPADLKVTRIFADGARSLKRYQPCARGRASHILKRSCHITVIVDEEKS